MTDDRLETERALGQSMLDMIDRRRGAQAVPWTPTTETTETTTETAEAAEGTDAEPAETREEFFAEIARLQAERAERVAQETPIHRTGGVMGPNPPAQAQETLSDAIDRALNRKA